jgi:hypothetical protein
MSVEIRTTKRGGELRFTDADGDADLVIDIHPSQKSLWIGGEFHATGDQTFARLEQDHAAALWPILKTFSETGRLR